MAVDLACHASKTRVRLPLGRHIRVWCNGNMLVSKTTDRGSNPLTRAIFSHSSMERTTGYEPVNWGSSPHVKTNILT